MKADDQNHFERRGKKAYNEYMADYRLGSEYFLKYAVFTGHVHNYQRFTREVNGREIPYLVVRSWGDKLHKMQTNGNRIIKTPFKLPDRDDVVLESYCDDRYGFMRLEITAGKLDSFRQEHVIRMDLYMKKDEFELDLYKHKLVG